MLGKYEDAEALYRRAVEGQETVLGPDNPETIRNTRELAALLLEQDRRREAEDLYRHVLQTQARVFGTDHCATLSTMSELARVLLVRPKSTLLRICIAVCWMEWNVFLGQVTLIRLPQCRALLKCTLHETIFTLLK
jgi:hypothetical protein